MSNIRTLAALALAVTVTSTSTAAFATDYGVPVEPCPVATHSGYGQIEPIYPEYEPRHGGRPGIDQVYPEYAPDHSPAIPVHAPRKPYDPAAGYPVHAPATGGYITVPPSDY